MECMRNELTDSLWVWWYLSCQDCPTWSPGPLTATTSGPPTTYGRHNWSPGPLMATTAGPPDHLWPPQLVPRTTYGHHNWSPGPLMAATAGPPDHLRPPQLVPFSPGGSGLGLGLGLGLEVRTMLISAYASRCGVAHIWWWTTYGMTYLTNMDTSIWLLALDSTALSGVLP